MDDHPRLGLTVDASGCDEDNLCWSGGVLVMVGADEDWGGLVARAVAEEWAGMELLAGLGGTVGEVVAGNGAAFGQQVADVVWSVRTWDSATASKRTFAMAECNFGQETSRFAVADGERGRYDVLEVTFLLRDGTLSAPVRDEALAARLGVPVGSRLELAPARDAVLGA